MIGTKFIRRSESSIECGPGLFLEAVKARISASVAPHEMRVGNPIRPVSELWQPQSCIRMPGDRTEGKMARWGLIDSLFGHGRIAFLVD